MGTKGTSFNVINNSCLTIFPLSSIQSKTLEYRVKKKLIKNLIPNRLVFHCACCVMFSNKSGFVKFSTELVVEYLPTRFVADWFSQS